LDRQIKKEIIARLTAVSDSTEDEDMWLSFANPNHQVKTKHSTMCNMLEDAKEFC